MTRAEYRARRDAEIEATRLMYKEFWARQRAEEVEEAAAAATKAEAEEAAK